jgi:periplasmic protein TonB
MITVAHNSVPMHHRKYGANDSTRRMIGWAAVLLIHAVVFWAFVTGTARRGLEIIKKPLEAAVIQEVIIPPPPPPPPKEIKPPKQPKAEAPPPPFVPPPEVAPPAAAAPPITAVQTPPPAPPVIAAPPPAPALTRANIKVACPTQVKPDMPSKASKEGIEGVVRAQVVIRDGSVVKVEILSGPAIFRGPVRDALMQYRCVQGAGEMVATQEFVFKVE